MKTLTILLFTTILFSQNSIVPAGGNSSKVNELTFYTQVNTYLEMLNIITPTQLRIVKVLNDENKGIDNTIYYLYPDGTRMWIAAVED